MNIVNILLDSAWEWTVAVSQLGIAQVNLVVERHSFAILAEPVEGSFASLLSGSITAIELNTVND